MCIRDSAGVEQGRAEVERYAPAAQYHYVADTALVGADGLEKSAHLRGGADDMEHVARREDEVALGDDDAPVVLDCADEKVGSRCV